ncbi:hypothetical protein M758_9G100000 [Ceratodon purpureus]|nr:hypothetical protein M758_9G100000 [Ceratodon purpureus]
MGMRGDAAVAGYGVFRNTRRLNSGTDGRIVWALVLDVAGGTASRAALWAVGWSR